MTPVPYAGEAAGLACAFTWSSAAFLWGPVGDRAGPVALSAFKALAGFAAFAVGALAFTGSPWPAIPAKGQLLLAASGVIGLALGDAFYFHALVTMGPRRALLLWLATPPLTALIGWAALGERIGAAEVAGVALVMAGIAWVQLEKPDAGRPLARRAILLGTGAGLLASLGQAVASAMTKQVLNEGASPLVVPQVRLAAAAVVLLAAGLATGRLRAWAAPFRERAMLGRGLAATAVGTVLGLLLMTYSQMKIPVGLSNTLSSTSPLFALPLAAVVLKERVSARAAAGTAVAFAGVVLVFLG